MILLMPLGLTAWSLFYNPDALGANPVEEAIHETGEWAIRLLLVTLAVSPLRRLFRLNYLINFRRMLGLLCFTYVCAHFSLFIVFEHFFSWHDVWNDIYKRPYITVGFLAFLLLKSCLDKIVNSESSIVSMKSSGFCSNMTSISDAMTFAFQ